MSSVRSVATPELFLGQATQMAPSAGALPALLEPSRLVYTTDHFGYARHGLSDRTDHVPLLEDQMDERERDLFLTESLHRHCFVNPDTVDDGTTVKESHRIIKAVRVDDGVAGCRRQV